MLHLLLLLKEDGRYKMYTVTSLLSIILMMYRYNLCIFVVGFIAGFGFNRVRAEKVRAESSKCLRVRGGCGLNF